MHHASPLLLLTVLASGCAKSTDPATSPIDGYGYENVNDPGAEAEARAAKRPTSCVGVSCAPPRVCRLLSTSDPGAIARAYCLGPDDDLCKLDPQLCQDSICRTQPGLCE